MFRGTGTLVNSSYDKEELRGFARSMAELQWLLLILVILYFFIPTRPITDSNALIITMVSYAVFVLLFRYSNFQARETRWKLAVETWAMITFISLVLSYTGLVESPLLNLYLLVIIACAITLGKLMTLLEVMLIASCYLYMAYLKYSTGVFAAETFTMLMAKFSPFLLVAYVTSMLSSDILNAKRRITLLSRTDDLTGLLNMRAFNDLLEKEIARVTRYAQPLTVIMVDVDSLKGINDRYGHTAGSRLIRTIGQSISESVRNTDVVARYGGDEFALILPETPVENAVKVAQRIQSELAAVTVSEEPAVGMTVSIGVAELSPQVASPRDWVVRADRALYEAKSSGRNCIRVFERDIPEDISI